MKEMPSGCPDELLLHLLVPCANRCRLSGSVMHPDVLGIPLSMQSCVGKHMHVLKLKEQPMHAHM